MSILKFIKGTRRSIQGMFDYICNPMETDWEHIFGIGINPYTAVAEMEFVQNLYFYKNPWHQYKQVVFAFNPFITETVDMPIITEISIKIADILLNGEKRQLLGGIHYKDRELRFNKEFRENIHCHYMINSIGLDGSSFRQAGSIYHYIFAINDLLEEYGVDPIPFWRDEEYYD